MEMSKAQRKALLAAVGRPRKTICPIRGVHAAAETTLINSLDRNGWIEWQGPVPCISDAGRTALIKERQSHAVVNEREQE